MDGFFDFLFSILCPARNAIDRRQLAARYETQEREWRETSKRGHRFHDRRPCEVCRGSLGRTVFLKYGSRDNRERPKAILWMNRVYMKDAEGGDGWYVLDDPLFEHEYVDVDVVEKKISRCYSGEVEELLLPDGSLLFHRKRRSTTTYKLTKRTTDKFSLRPERLGAWHAHGVWRPDLACFLCGGCLHKFAEEPPRNGVRIAWHQCRHCGIRWVQNNSFRWVRTDSAPTKANLLRTAEFVRTLDRSRLLSGIASAVGNLMPPVSFEALAEHLRENHLAYNLTDKLIRRGIKLAITTGQISIQPGILSKDGFPFYRHGTREPPKVSATIRLSDVPEDQRTGEKPWLVIMKGTNSGE